jgi:hypothetical protein
MERGQTTDKLRTTGESEKPEGYTTTTAYDQSVAHQVTRNGRSKGKNGRGFNFRMLADVLEAESAKAGGLDIAQAIVDALKSNKLDEKTKLLAQLELLQYLQPKMKAIEHKGKIELDSETVDARLKYLMEKIGATGGNRPGSAD